MDMMSLLIKIGADDKEAKEAINNFRSDLQKTGRESDGIFSKLKTAFGTVGKAAAAGFTAAGGAIIGLTKSIVDAYGDYEQLTGGVETLFKDSADVVMQYANNAYKTAGLSANEYMSTVTSFSASLIQSLGGDTSKAAKLSDVAISDMADKVSVRLKRIEPYQGCGAKRPQEMAA